MTGESGPSGAGKRELLQQPDESANPRAEEIMWLIEEKYLEGEQLDMVEQVLQALQNIPDEMTIKLGDEES